MNINELLLRFGILINSCSVEREDSSELNMILMGMIQHNMISGLPISAFNFKRNPDCRIVQLALSIYNAFCRHEFNKTSSILCRRLANDSTDVFQKSAWTIIAQLGEIEDSVQNMFSGNTEESIPVQEHPSRIPVEVTEDDIRRFEQEERKRLAAYESDPDYNFDDRPKERVGTSSIIGKFVSSVKICATLIASSAVVLLVLFFLLATVLFALYLIGFRD